MATKNSEDLLRDRNLKATPHRIAVLNKFTQTDRALTQGELSEALPDIDRVTIYRTLNALEKSGIIHQAAKDNRDTFYAICPTKCGNSEHKHQHLHLHCTECSGVFCIEIPKISLPDDKGYKIEDLDIQAKGICETCSAT
jgi:Fur family ferric uptake transcriptional regulator